MVVLKEIGSQKMFWGVTLDGGKRYTQTVERSFHISMAALEPPTSKVGVMVSVDKAEFLLCSLGYNGVLQQPLDLMFTEGEEVTFFLNGSGVVHLTGYLVEDQPEDLQGLYDDSDEAPELVDISEEESDEDEEDSMAVVKSIGTKRKMKEVGKVAKKAKLAQLDSDDDDEDDDYDSEDMSALDFLDDEASEDSDDEMDEDDFDEDLDEDEDSEEEYVKKTPGKTPNKSPQKKGANSTPVQNKDTPRPVEKKQTPGKPGQQTPKQSPGKLGQQTPKQTPGKPGQQTPGKGKQTPGEEQKPQNTETPNTEGKKKKKKKKNKNKGDDSVNEASTPKPGSATPGKKVMSGGIVMEETKSGHGPEAKSGKMVSVYYVGKLSSNGKQFDSCTQGKPFRFRLGKNEVIKGWDVGLQGMKVGGKRRLTIPPQQAYGNAKVGHIPASSTLVFDVELKAVN
ncbi:46 kDa FK506-binding nuclear protein-like isoform X1 [Ostrea edulis]|uniref:46 kDa FK506-binding nuclear protein-like isoform X1 n=1 Tax=Ostrea edulis TaxID=37623 RepID=UPI0024AFAA7B|nr:46 kDa FK506-binding nuclear protein-like isoform X1 [Ostrea edulis]